MDFSGIGMSLISCCFVILVPPIPASIAFFAIDTFRKSHASPTSRTQSAFIFAALYLIALAISCLFAYFAFLKDMYVM